MNKKTSILLSAVGALIALALAVLLIAKGCAPQKAPSGNISGSTSATTDALLPSGEVSGTEQDPNDGTQKPVGEDTPTFEVELGVGSRDEFPDKEETTGSTVTEIEQKPQDEPTQKPTGGKDTPATQPSAPDDEDKDEDKDTVLTYAQYIALAPEQQEAYVDTFDSLKAFINWYNTAKAEYDQDRDSIEIDGPIDLEDIIGTQP